MNANTVILANGCFPSHPLPRAVLSRAAQVVCCDGAANTLASMPELAPVAIVGDGDSLSEAARTKFSACLVTRPCQETNDLTKAFRFCLEQGWTELVILGGTGKREDHTLGNLSLLADFSREASVLMLTDTCLITPVSSPVTLPATPGQPVSFIACDSGVRLSVEGVQYPVQDLALTRWSTATLNVATGDAITVHPVNGIVLVFQAYS